MFLDYAMQHGVLVNLSQNGRPTPVFDSGNTRLSVTTVDSNGKAVTSSLQARHEDVQIRTLYIHDAVISQNQTLGYAKELAPDRESNTITIDCKKMAEQGYEKIRNGENKTLELLRMFMPLVSFGWGMVLFEKTDNCLLGLDEWNAGQLRALVKNILEGGQQGQWADKIGARSAGIEISSERLPDDTD